MKKFKKLVSLEAEKRIRQLLEEGLSAAQILRILKKEQLSHISQSHFYKFVNEKIGKIYDNKKRIWVDNSCLASSGHDIQTPGMKQIENINHETCKEPFEEENNNEIMKTDKKKENDKSTSHNFGVCENKKEETQRVGLKTSKKRGRPPKNYSQVQETKEDIANDSSLHMNSELLTNINENIELLLRSIHYIQKSDDRFVKEISELKEEIRRLEGKLSSFTENEESRIPEKELIGIYKGECLKKTVSINKRMFEIVKGYLAQEDGRKSNDSAVIDKALLFACLRIYKGQ